MGVQPKPTSELVITVPSPYDSALAYKARARMTIGVLTQLISQAQQEVIVVAPFLQRDAGLSEPPLSNALQAALENGVQVHIASTSRGLKTLQLASPLAQYSSQIHLYQPQTHLDSPHRLGSHAKFCCVDGEQAYIGSANLTRPGLGEHFELGVLVHGSVANQIKVLWDYLVQIGFFVPQATKYYTELDI